MFVSLFFSSFDLLPCSNRGVRGGAKVMRSVNLLLQVAYVSFNISYMDHFSPAGSNMGFTRANRPQDAGVIGLFKYNSEKKHFCFPKDAQIITKTLAEHTENNNN